MNTLYLMFTITDRNKTRRFQALYESRGVEVHFLMTGSGTAGSELLEYFGLERTEKAVMLAVVTDDTWRELRRGLERRLQIDVPGTGVVFAVPMSSIGGKKTLRYFTAEQSDGTPFTKRGAEQIKRLQGSSGGLFSYSNTVTPSYTYNIGAMFSTYA